MAIDQSRATIKVNAAFESVIVVQNLYGTLALDKHDISSLKREGIRLYIQFGKGLSRSRNLALSYVATLYAWILDGDIKINKNELSRLVDLIRSSKDDTPFFLVKAKCLEHDRDFKRYNRFHCSSIEQILRVSSIEMIVNSTIQKNLGVWFNERLGLGGDFCGTEEADFLLSMYRKKKSKVSYFNIHPVIHTCMAENRSKPGISIFYARGNILRRIGGLKSLFIFFYWAVKFSYSWRTLKVISYLYKGYRYGLPS